MVPRAGQPYSWYCQLTAAAVQKMFSGLVLRSLWMALVTITHLGNMLPSAENVYRNNLLWIGKNAGNLVVILKFSFQHSRDSIFNVKMSQVSAVLLLSVDLCYCLPVTQHTLVLLELHLKSKVKIFKRTSAFCFLLGLTSHFK